MSNHEGVRRKVAYCGLAIAALVLLWPWVYMVSCAAYTYVYWMFPEVNWVAPGVEETVRGELPVPAIIHQTWKTKEVPEKWRKAQQSCIDLHPDYEYKLWTDADGERLIEVRTQERRRRNRRNRLILPLFSQEHYSWFLPTYLSYPYAIQRVDAVRYFILHRHGGVYIDLDMGCTKRVDFLRASNFTAPATYPVGVSNDVMAARPRDAYTARLIANLPRWNHWLFIKYIQVMFGTGPMFLTVQYALMPGRMTDGVGVIAPPEYGKYDFSGEPTFYHLHGSSWHADDAAFVFWMDKYKRELVAAGVVAAAGLGVVAWRRRRRANGGSPPPGALRVPTVDLEKQF